MESSEVSREDIAKKFDLPERKSKINTILKMQHYEPVYCLCQSTDISRFMICCEKCDEWYHGDCIGLAEEDSKIIKTWYCCDCTEKYNLQIVYFPCFKKSSSSKKKRWTQQPSYKQGFVRFQDSRCGQCSNCLQNQECGNKSYIFAEEHANYLDKVVVSQADTAISKIHKHKESINANKENRNKHGQRYLQNWKQMQCYGPNCIKSARVNSKYCSDDCGLALAKLRILSILPQRIAEREAVPCVADQLDTAKLENCRLLMKFTLKRLKELDYKEKKLLDQIARSKLLPIVETHEVDEDSKMDCLTCGWEIATRSAGRHMEICYKKVCGCPLIQTMSLDIFSGAEKFCQQPKKKCNQHYNWDILALAEVDLERLREWNKMNQLVEEESILLRQLSNRSGALALLLHSTTPED